MTPRDDTTIVVIDASFSVDKLAMYAEINRLARGPMIEIVMPDIAERAVMAIEHHVKLVKTFREIEHHPRYQDRTPRSPKPRFRKGR